MYVLFQIKIHGTSAECFLAFLEYLYTDHSPIEETDAVGLLVVADEYGQNRLQNLCELYITKEVDRSVAKNIEKSDIDVIGLLLTSQVKQNSNSKSTRFLFFNVKFAEISVTLSQARNIPAEISLVFQPFIKEKKNK